MKGIRVTLCRIFDNTRHVSHGPTFTHALWARTARTLVYLVDVRGFDP